MSILFSCNSEHVSDCFRKTGSVIIKEISVDQFNEINVLQGVELLIKQGDKQKIVLETGSNLIANIQITVVDSTLSLINNNSCNWVRNYNMTKVYVTTPNIEAITSNTQFTIKSEGILNFPVLHVKTIGATSIFDLELNCDYLYVESNSASFFHFSGTSRLLNVNFADGQCRFDARHLIVEEVNFFHRSSNDIIVNPRSSIVGGIYSSGNVVLINKPPVIKVNEYYKGKLVF